MNGDILAVDIAPVPIDKAKARFLAVAGYDSTVRLLSLDDSTFMTQMGIQQTDTSYATYLLFMESEKYGKSKRDKLRNGTQSYLFLHISLSSGVLMRTSVNKITGELYDARWRFLGLQAPRLTLVTVNGN